MLEDRLWWLIIKIVVGFLGANLTGLIIYFFIYFSIMDGYLAWQSVGIILAALLIFGLLITQIILSSIKIYKKWKETL